MPFGKWRGYDLTELPDPYLEWLVFKCEIHNPELRTEVVNEYERRARPHDAVVPAPVRSMADELIAAGYRSLAKRCHPDAGGDHQAMITLSRARDLLALLVAHAG